MNDNQFITGSEVLKTYKANKFNQWNVSSSSSELSKNTNDASTRIYLDYAQVKVNYSSVPEKKFDRSTAIFAMGSCFAREIEKALIHSGCNIVSDDVIVANTYSKSVLRAAVSIFEKAHENVKYFPSYEMIINSKRDLAWRPDRIHVNPGMVDHIVNNFTSLFFEV
jgi:hypothetical protein